MSRGRIVKMLSLALMWSLGGLVGPAVAAEISVTTTFTAAPPVSTPGCDDGTGTTVVEVPGVGIFTPSCQAMDWSTASSYCAGLGNGYTLPTKDQLVALYNAYPNNQMNTTWGWPTDYGYWSSTQYGSGYHYYVSLYNGNVHYSYDSIGKYVACVR